MLPSLWNTQCTVCGTASEWERNIFFPVGSKEQSPYFPLPGMHMPIIATRKVILIYRRKRMCGFSLKKPGQHPKNSWNMPFPCGAQAFSPYLLSYSCVAADLEIIWNFLSDFQSLQALFNETTLRKRERAEIMIMLCFKQNYLRLPGDSYFDSTVRVSPKARRQTLQPVC